MIKYASTALMLQLLSLNRITRRFYRTLGNAYGVRKRLTRDIPLYYIDRIKRFLSMNSKYNIVKDGDKVLEVGTGWLHWEALTMRLFHDVEAVLFDVWDNRQFAAIKHHFSCLDSMLDNGITLTDSQRTRAHRVIAQIISADSLDTLYHRLGLEYVLEPSGSLCRFPDQTFDVIVSAGVLEHVNRSKLDATIKEFQRVLKCGGSSIHTINIADHLYAYDNRVSQKQYLRFSDTVWKTFFENEVQYFNRIQRSEWLDRFANSGLQLIEEEPEYNVMHNLKIHPQFKHLNKSDIECTWLKLLHRRPNHVATSYQVDMPVAAISSPNMAIQNQPIPHKH